MSHKPTYGQLVVPFALNIADTVNDVVDESAASDAQDAVVDLFPQMFTYDNELGPAISKIVSEEAAAAKQRVVDRLIAEIGVTKLSAQQAEGAVIGMGYEIVVNAVDDLGKTQPPAARSVFLHLMLQYMQWGTLNTTYAKALTDGHIDAEDVETIRQSSKDTWDFITSSTAIFGEEEEAWENWAEYLQAFKTADEEWRDHLSGKCGCGKHDGSKAAGPRVEDADDSDLRIIDAEIADKSELLTLARKINTRRNDPRGDLLIQAAEESLKKLIEHRDQLAALLKSGGPIKGGHVDLKDSDFEGDALDAIVDQIHARIGKPGLSKAQLRAAIEQSYRNGGGITHVRIGD